MSNAKESKRSARLREIAKQRRLAEAERDKALAIAREMLAMLEALERKIQPPQI